MARKRPPGPTAPDARRILDAANWHYADGFVDLQRFYDAAGRERKGSGDMLGAWIVGEVVSSIEEGVEQGLSEEEIIETAIQRLEAGCEDIEKAIRGLRERQEEARG
jgi:hypothetical protein